MRKKLSELYAKLGLEGASRACLESQNSKKNQETILPNSHADRKCPFSSEDVNAWMNLFAINQIVFQQFVDRLGRHGYKPAPHKLTPKFLENHWRGIMTISVQVIDNDNSVKFALFDLDVSRKNLEYMKVEEINTLKEKILLSARNIQEKAFKSGIIGILEDSGYKGYHLWFFFEERIPAELASNFLKALSDASGNPPEGTHRELFPASAEIGPENLNSRIKLPLGLHKLSGKFSKFLLPDGSPAKDQIRFINSESILNKTEKIRKAVQFWNRFKTQNIPNPDNNDPLSTLYSKCSILRALRQKAQEERFLSHYERTVLRGILAPLGENGRNEIHNILKNCDNYSRKITDKMIGNIDHFPMGCHKIREILSDIASMTECACSFKKRAGQYPHPLRHLESAPKFDIRTMEIKNPPRKSALPQNPSEQENKQPTLQTPQKNTIVDTQPKEAPPAQAPAETSTEIPEIIEPINANNEIIPQQNNLNETEPSYNSEISTKKEESSSKNHNLPEPPKEKLSTEKTEKSFFSMKINFGKWKFNLDFGVKS